MNTSHDYFRFQQDIYALSDLMSDQLVNAFSGIRVPDPGGPVVRGGRQALRADPDKVHDVP